MPVINEDGSVGWFWYENGPGDFHYIGIDRSSAPDRCYLHTRAVFEDGTFGPTKTREITFAEMVAHKAALALIQRRGRS